MATVKTTESGKIMIGACTVGSHASTFPTVSKNGINIPSILNQSAGGYGSATSYFLFDCNLNDTIVVQLYGAAGAGTGATGSICIVQFS